ncbi:hypothetical protein BMETH_1894_0 [methanotrophic bacterial endosymbiont of Bathymodiolus sp.]|nr:hypothetical protein BMETH_1894_0 [methanotrophic bacterial endosymbiont of Bathymodiolus sp.]
MATSPSYQYSPAGKRLQPTSLLPGPERVGSFSHKQRRCLYKL